MSHRVTTRTEMKDKKLAEKALKSAGMDYNVQGDTILITSGPMRHSSIDLKSGVVTGDTDVHNENILGMLKQEYGEAKYVQECASQGITVESRSVNKEGEIILMCAMG